MNITEAINYRNSQNPGRQFKVSKNWVMVKYNCDKRFSDHSSIEKFIDNVEDEIRTNNSSINSKKTVEFVLSLGLNPDNKSITGSTYFYTPKGHLRISNHHFTSEKHDTPELNLCSYEENGFESMIKQAKQFLNI